MSEDDVVETFKALGHSLRWRILCAVAARERNVGEIEQVTGISQPGLSQQLAVLRRAGLVETRKDAKLVYYRLASQPVGNLFDVLAQLMPAPSIPQTPSTAHGVASFARMS